MTIIANPEAVGPRSRPRTGADSPSREGPDRFAKWAIGLFFAAAFIPGELNVGINLPPYRLLLLVLAVPMLLRFRDDPTLRINSVDVFVFLAIFWRSLAIVVNHQMDQALNAISSFVDLFFAYMLGRVFIRSVEDFRYFFRCFLWLLLAFLPFALVEAVARERVLREIAGLVLDVSNDIAIEGNQVRFGLLRAMTAFEHPILFGNFCATAFANVYYVYWRQFPRNLAYAGFAGFVALTALSSSSILTLALQSAMIAYERIFRVVWFKWIVAALAIIPFWFGFQMVMGRSFFDYVVNELTISPYVGAGRIEIFVYGMKNVYAHPIFGIGLNDWVRPFWRNNPSMDNHWLFFAMRYGLPAFLFLAIAYGVQFFRLFLVVTDDPDLRNIRTGYAIALFAQVLMLGTHAIWGTANAFVMVYLGVGVWIWEAARREAEDARLARRRARTAASARARDHHSASA